MAEVTPPSAPTGTGKLIVYVALAEAEARNPPSASCPSGRSPKLQLKVAPASPKLHVVPPGVIAVILAVRPPSGFGVGPVGAKPLSFTAYARLAPVLVTLTVYEAVLP